MLEPLALAWISFFINFAHAITENHHFCSIFSIHCNSVCVQLNLHDT